MFFLAAMGAANKQQALPLLPTYSLTCMINVLVKNFLSFVLFNIQGFIKSKLVIPKSSRYENTDLPVATRIEEVSTQPITSSRVNFDRFRCGERWSGHSK